MEQQSLDRRAVLTLCLGLLFSLWVNGALPFILIPTLGQAVGTTVGWAQAFINEGWFNIYSHNFGYPEPAARSFGLVGVITTSLFMRLGLHGADAYSSMVAFWLSISFFSAYKLGRYFNARPVMAALGAVLWVTMPIVRIHAGYSMLSLGMALMPFYFLSALKLLLGDQVSLKPKLLDIGLYALAVVIAVFMDGYTFMMFATGASILWAYIALRYTGLRKRSFFLSAPVHAASFAFAYLLYMLYIGKPEYEASSMNFFRGWGLDVAFALVPTKGEIWIADLLGFSQARPAILYFGDSSVWKTTFALPILLLGLFSWWRLFRHAKLASGLLLVAVFGFYMALGPSLKVNSTTPETMRDSPARMSSMPAELAVAPTGSAWVSEHVPGFKSMRASYRWTALGVFGLWALFMLLAGNRAPKHNLALGGLFLGAIALNLPNLYKKPISDYVHRQMFFDIDSELIASLGTSLRRNEVVAFIPYRNDLLVNYIASKLDIRTYNIGGDKNLNQATKSWPATLTRIGFGEIDGNRIQEILLSRDADAIVIPYFHSTQAAHLWPCGAETKYASEARQPSIKTMCPSQQKQELAGIVGGLKQTGYLQVEDTGFFAVVRIRPERIHEADNLLTSFRSNIYNAFNYPITIKPDVKNLNWIVQDGWHAIEPTHVWSTAQSTIRLPVPKDCQAKDCTAQLKFGVLVADEQRPVTVKITATDPAANWSQTIIVKQPNDNEITLPLKGAWPTREFLIEVPEAVSPVALNVGADLRVLGMKLHEIELRQGSYSEAQ